MANLRKKKNATSKKGFGKSREDILREKREREKARREKIKNNPEKYEKQRQKERERYQERKIQGKIKLINDLSDREKRQKRKSWVINNKTYRQNKKKLSTFENEVLCNIPSNSDVDVEQIRNNELGEKERNLRKKINRLKVKAYRDAVRQKKLIESLKRENRNLRSTALRSKVRDEYKDPEKNTNIPTLPDLTPNTKVDKILENAGVAVPSSIRKQLLFGECIKQQLKENFKSFKDHRTKQIFAKVVGGRVLKKYRLTNTLNMSPYFSKSYSKNNRNRRASKIQNMKKDIVEFYENDENSRLCAGKKECLTYKKVKKQKRYMNYSLQSLHSKYIKEKQIKISYSAFCRLRPFWVVPPRVGSRDTCLCIPHDNFRLITEKLYKEKVIRVKNPEELITSITCQSNREECLSRDCEECKETQVPFNEFNGEITCQYQQWRTKKETRVNGKTGKPIAVQITLKEDILVSHYTLTNELLKLVPKYIIHLRNIYHQHQALSSIKKSLADSSLLLHIDFSENYACKYSSEAQSVHFGASRQQITLHTGVAYNKNHVKSFCTISPSLRHDANSIAAHLIPIIRHFSADTNIDTLFFLSDSPSTQYRNKTMFSIIAKYLPLIFPKVSKISWSYSEAGHGKGAPDGVGATLKRTADRLVAEKHDIPNFNEFLKIIKDNVFNIFIDTVDDSDINKVDNEMIKSFETFKGTMQVHNITWSREDQVLYLNRLTCLSCEIGKSCCHYQVGAIQTTVEHKNQEKAIIVGSKVTVSPAKIASDVDHNSSRISSEPDVKSDDWVVVLFDFWYPGIVLSKNGDFLKIQFMERKGKQFCWPAKRDI